MTNKSLNYDKYKGHTGPWKQSLIGQIADAADLVAVVNMHACNPANEALIADSPLILQRCMELEEVFNALGDNLSGLEAAIACESWEGVEICYGLIGEIIDQALSKQREGE